MFVSTYAGAVAGIDAVKVTVEVNLTGGGLGLYLVGLPDNAVKESEQRIRAAFENTGRKMSGRKVVVNLAPADLRESGAIEQDADIVAFIHRPEYYGINQDENGMPTAGMAEIIIAKHRNGAVTDVNLRFLKDQARFADVDETLMPEAGSRPAPGQYEDVSSGSNSGLGGFGGVPEEFLTPGVSGAPVNLNEEEPF